ncbi:MAG: 4Fe-4S binding protein [Xanthomonadaceae bacterium]|jgi:NosR/NirI family nitrous oxide reductase transcriptional regulator|nr:4Fe-4S binding protein [Xanthomonadaceae bacterium]
MKSSLRRFSTSGGTAGLIRVHPWLVRLVGSLLCALTGIASASSQTSYEAALPDQLFTGPDLCRYAACDSVLPQAQRFSLREGNPAFVKGLRERDGQEEVVGYVFLSTDVAPEIVGYSGKPIVTLVGMDIDGRINGVRILKHSEPILLAGIPEEDLNRYIDQYVGKPAGARYELGRAEGDHVPMNAVSGATVTVIAENQMISRGSHAVARQVGLIEAVARPQARFSNDSAERSWAELAKEGSVRRLTVAPAQVGAADTGQPFIDMWFGYLNAPGIGISVLGKNDYQHLMASLQPDEHAIFIIANGTSSFKGSAFVRGGIYDRIQVSQDFDIYTFRDTDYLNLYGIHAAGAPAYGESGIFMLRDKSFSAAYPWRLTFLSNRSMGVGETEYANFDAEYWLPGTYLQGGRPSIEARQPAWVKIWKAKRWEIAVFVGLLAFTAAFYAMHRHWAARSRRADKRWILWPHIAIWLAAVIFVGFGQLAQPSVVQALTLLHSLWDGWRWDLFLSDPLIFIFWIFIAITIVLWGRGVFCGWLCPYGSLSELLYKLAGRIGLKCWQFELPSRWHHRLRWLKYLVLAALVAASLHSMALAERMAEVEPFKSTFLVYAWIRSWPFLIFWTVLMVAALFIERPFCKYLCPLGAALAIPSRWRLFGLWRKAECTTCKACAAGCGSQAIDGRGRIDPAECMQCLDCMVLYYDDHACPPLAKERKRREREGLPLTPVGRDGRFIPLKVVE